LSVLLVDDHLLLRVLLEDEPDDLRVEERTIATTGLWYHRLCRALANDTVIGSISRQLGSADAELAKRVLAAVVTLPDEITLVSLKTLGWPMGELVSERVRLNLLSLEALAAAQHLSAEICLAAVDDNVPLQSAARAFGVPMRVIHE